MTIAKKLENIITHIEAHREKEKTLIDLLRGLREQADEQGIGTLDIELAINDLSLSQEKVIKRRLRRGVKRISDSFKGQFFKEEVLKLLK